MGVTFSYDESGTLPQLPQELAIALFQCARELVFNVAKHASATTGSVELAGGDSEVLLTVADDGKGFVSGDAPRSPGSTGGSGLFSIRERVALFGGQLSIVTSATGSRVTLRMPVVSAAGRGTVGESAPRQGDPGNPQAQA
jgi:signal transduction histidine kinase